jgi:L-asparaginase
MKHILLLSTGGTIASEQTKTGLAPSHSGAELIAEIPALTDLCQITCREILNLDSSNIQPEDWVTMAEAIFEEYERYDGFVITHGTDTMAYSASALSMMLKHLQKPVIFTGSQLALTVPGSDGIQNIYDAFCTAVSGISGVYIVFYGRIIQGIRAQKLYTKDFDAFHSINAEDIGTVKNGTVQLHTKISIPKGRLRLQTSLETKVAVIKLIPGTDPILIEQLVNLGYKGIIIEAFGCGGIPNTNRNLLPAIEKAIKSGITVMIASQCLYEPVDLTVYDVNVQAARLGVLSANDMTIEAATVSLMLKLGESL